MADDNDDFLREIDELLGEDGDTNLSEEIDSGGTFDLDDLDVKLDDPEPVENSTPKPQPTSDPSPPRPPSPPKTKYVLYCLSSIKQHYLQYKLQYLHYFDAVVFAESMR